MLGFWLIAMLRSKGVEGVAVARRQRHHGEIRLLGIPLGGAPTGCQSSQPTTAGSKQDVA